MIQIPQTSGWYLLIDRGLQSDSTVETYLVSPKDSKRGLAVNHGGHKLLTSFIGERKYGNDILGVHGIRCLRKCTVLSNPPFVRFSRLGFSVTVTRLQRRPFDYTIFSRTQFVDFLVQRLLIHLCPSGS